MNKYNKIIIRQKWWISIPILIVSALIFTFSVGIFITASQIFPKGVSAYVQLIIYIFHLNSRWFSIILLIFNVPLCIIFWKSLGRRFVFYTALWLLFQFAWSQLIFSFKIDINPFQFSKNGDKIVPSGIIIYGLIGAIFIAISIGFCFLAGGSSGGMDFLVYYYYLKKQKSVGFYSMLFGFITVFSSVIIQYLVGKSIEDSVYHLFFGVTTFVTILYILVYSMVLSFIYPRHKRVKVEISSKYNEKIIKYLIDSQFHHGYSVRKERSVYSRKNTEVITTIISYMELYTFITNIKKVDPDAWISIIYVQHVFGRFNDKLITS